MYNYLSVIILCEISIKIRGMASVLSQQNHEERVVEPDSAGFPSLSARSTKTVTPS